MVDISKLRDGFKRVYVNGEIKSVAPSRTVNLKTGSTATIAEAELADATGSITLSLWNEQIPLVKAGSKVKIENAFVTSFKGKNQLSLGKFGRLTIVP